MHRTGIWSTNLDGSGKSQVMTINNGTMFDYDYANGRIYWVEDEIKVCKII